MATTTVDRTMDQLLDIIAVMSQDELEDLSLRMNEAIDNRFISNYK